MFVSVLIMINIMKIDKKQTEVFHSIDRSYNQIVDSLNFFLFFWSDFCLHSNNLSY